MPPGDIVRVSNTDATIYLTLTEYASSTDAQLRYLLTQRSVTHQT